MENVKLAEFEGLMAPVFTPYDENNEVNYDVIEPYAKLLKSNGIDAILVNGTSGEGMLLSADERKKVTEKWMHVCKKLNILMMIQISGCSFADVIQLAKHAEALKVDGVLCLPELYFKPKTIEKLVQYMKNISVYCPTTSIYYYHIPMFTQVDLPMSTFMELASREIPTFCGIKYTSGDLEKGLPCLKYGQVFLGSDTILCGALALGFKSAIMTSLNIVPDLSLKIVEHMKKNRIEEAREQQMILCEFVENTLKSHNNEWVPSMKRAFNEKFQNLCLGDVRKPL
jgi:N-acetylneuraminate lyase